jgi:hypothetical protein
MHYAFSTHAQRLASAEEYQTSVPESAERCSMERQIKKALRKTASFVLKAIAVSVINAIISKPNNTIPQQVV